MRERYVQLLIALLLLLVLYPLAVETGLTRWLRLVFILVLAAAAFAVSGRKHVLVVALGLGLPALAAQASAVALPGRSTFLLAGLFTFLFLAFVTVVILGSVLAPGKVTRDKIAGAISVYLLLGLVWALLYITLALANPAAFRVPDEVAIQLGEGSEYTFFYFSFVTLTTLGFGDVTPTTPVSQALAWLEAVTGQLYLAVLVARLVGLHIVHSGPRELLGPGEDDEEQHMSHEAEGVLVLCTGNSCRSQMAEAFLRHYGGDRIEAFSAGTEPAAEIHPLARRVMAEKGLDLEGQHPKEYGVYLSGGPIHTLITVCGGAAESCPAVWPGVEERLHWPIRDPAAFVGGDEETLVEFRQVRDELAARVRSWLDGRFGASAG